MEITKEIRLLGEGLKDRLDPSLIDFAIEYIDFSEDLVAFETLCDYIADYGVLVSRDEYKRIIDIASTLGLASDNRYSYINPDIEKWCVTLLVRKYDLDEIKNIITDYIDQCEGEDWMAIAQKLSRVFAWEYEDYQP